MSFCKSFLNNFGSKTVHFKVHLNGGNAVFCAGNFKVHIAIEIFKALDINHSHEIAVNALIARDKAAADACNGSLDRNTRSHKRKS